MPSFSCDLGVIAVISIPLAPSPRKSCASWWPCCWTRKAVNVSRLKPAAASQALAPSWARNARCSNSQHVELVCDFCLGCWMSWPGYIGHGGNNPMLLAQHSEPSIDSTRRLATTSYCQSASASGWLISRKSECMEIRGTQICGGRVETNQVRLAVRHCGCQFAGDIPACPDSSSGRLTSLQERESRTFNLYPNAGLTS